MGGPTWQIEDHEILDRRYQTADRVQRAKERVRLGVLKVISSAYEIPMSPWGILTGVRPTKLVHNLLDRGLTPDKVKDLLTDVYAVSLERAGLIQEIAAWQRQFFHASPNQPVGIYIGIPFCPTRCTYCSFAAYPVVTTGTSWLSSMKRCAGRYAVGRLLQRLGVHVRAFT